MTSNGRFRLLIVGVGGQGVLTAARVLGEAAMAEGRDVVLGQLHGMSQRSGSVESTVLLGPGRSSFIGSGEADALLALEPLEALRASSRLSPRCRALVSLGKIPPYTLAQGGKPYPDLERVLAPVRQAAGELVTLDGPAIAEAAGYAHTLNFAMLGALSGLGFLPLGSDAVEAAVESANRYGETNRRAFRLGREAVA